MNIATIQVSGVHARAVNSVIVPQGIVGASVTFDFLDPQWKCLSKTAVFQGDVTRDVIVQGNTAIIPAETVVNEGTTLKVGVYGTDDKNNLAIPTLWATIGKVGSAADPSGDPGTEPDLPIWAQLADEVDKLKRTNSGGNVELDTTLTQSGKAADAKAVGDAIKNLQLSGGGSLNIRDMEVNEIFTITGSGSGGSGDSGDSGDTDEPGDDNTNTGAVAINGRIIDIDMRNVQATDEYLTDTSGNGNHMKLSAVGSASKDNVWTPAYYDTTADVNKYVAAYTENTIDMSGDFTVEVFCEIMGRSCNYFQTNAPGWTGKDYALDIKGKNDNGTTIPCVVSLTSQPKNYYPAFDDLSAVFLPGNFYHITVARTGNDCSLYKNGELVQTITLTSEIPLNNRFYLNWKKLNSDGTAEGYVNHGTYKMLRAYTRALSATEIANHYSIELAKG